MPAVWQSKRESHTQVDVPLQCGECRKRSPHVVTRDYRVRHALGVRLFTYDEAVRERCLDCGTMRECTPSTARGPSPRRPTSGVVPLLTLALTGVLFWAFLARLAIDSGPSGLAFFPSGAPGDDAATAAELERTLSGSVIVEGVRITGVEARIDEHPFVVIALDDVEHVPGATRAQVVREVAQRVRRFLGETDEPFSVALRGEGGYCALGRMRADQRIVVQVGDPLPGSLFESSEDVGPLATAAEETPK